MLRNIVNGVTFVMKKLKQSIKGEVTSSNLLGFASYHHGKGLKTKFFEPEVSGKIVPLYPLLKDFFNLNNNSPNNEIDRHLNNNCQESRNGPQSEQQLNTHVPTPEQGTGANKNTFPGPNMMSNMMQANEPLPQMCGPPLLLSTQLSTPDGPIVKGESGLDGLPGVGGPKGDTGFPGQIGRAGNKGESGPPGLNGSPGLDGPRGENGPSGLPGRDGEPGLPGMKGDGGLPGFDGLPGPKGNPGNNGLPCVSGEKGNPGFSGPNGAPGLPGPKGERGFNGRDESKGEPGRTSEGSKGEPGLPGRSGLDGLPGMKGDVGFAGRDGFPSAKGESGNPGLEGIGQKGSRGLDGLPGSAGLLGESGVDGLTGVNGSKGESGDRGLNGLPGPQGNNGLDGRKDHNSPNNEIDEHLNNNCQECRNGPQSEQKLDTHVPTPEQGTGANKNYSPGPNMMSNMMQANEPLPEMCGPPQLLSTQLSTPDGPIVKETPQNDTDIDETMVKVPYEEDRGGNKGTPAPPQRFINLTRPHAVLLTDEDLNSPKNEIDRDLNNNCQECRNGPQSEQQLNTHVPTTEQQLNVQQAYDLEVSNLTLSFVRNLRIVEEEKQNLLVDLTAMRERCANLEDSKESSKRKLTSASLDKEQGTGAIKNYRPRPNTKSNMLQAKRPLPQMCGPPPLMSTKKLSTTGGAIVKAKVPVPIAIRPKVLKKNTGNTAVSLQSEYTYRGLKRKMEGEKSVTANPPTKRINMLKATETMGRSKILPLDVKQTTINQSSKMKQRG